MPMDSTRYPDLPPGAKLQPTADPETAYVLADDVATGRRTSIGIIRHGVFTPAPQYSLVAAQAEFSKAAEEPTASQPAAPAPHVELPDVFSKADDTAFVGESTSVPASVYLTSVFFAVLTGGTTPADAARFYGRHTGFVATLAGVAAGTLPPTLSDEAFRRFLAVLRPQETSQYLQKSLFTALSRYLKSAAAPTSDVMFDAARAALSVSTKDGLPAGFAYMNAVLLTDGTPARKPFFKAALEAGCDWVARLNPEDAASSALTASAEKTLSDADAGLFHHDTDRGVFTGAAGVRLPKSIQRALPGLGAGLVFSHKTAEGTTLFAASLPPVLPGLKRAAALLREESPAPVTVFFPAAAAGNAAVILNLAVIAKIAKAVKKNEERRRTIAGLPAWTPAEANDFFTEPAGAAQSTAAFLAVV